MTRKYTQLTFTDSVLAAQERFGARTASETLNVSALDDDPLSSSEAEFIAERDGFYMASCGADGWPYVQYRGGPRGFLKSIDASTLAFADFRGNRQYISTGNLTQNKRVSLFFMDYAKQRRLKLMAHSRIVLPNDHPSLLEQLADPAYPAHIERLVIFDVVAFDWNCPQHITARFTKAECSAVRD